jgi:hypothetical protein
MAIASIGMKNDPDIVHASARFDAVIQAVREFVLEHPELITCEGEFAVVFGDRPSLFHQTQLMAALPLGSLPADRRD